MCVYLRADMRISPNSPSHRGCPKMGLTAALTGVIVTPFSQRGRVTPCEWQGSDLTPGLLHPHNS